MKAMKDRTLADFNDIIENVIAHDDKLSSTYSFKRIVAETQIMKGITRFYIEAQVISQVNVIRTIFKSYTTLEQAIIDYNEIQF